MLSKDEIDELYNDLNANPGDYSIEAQEWIEALKKLADWLHACQGPCEECPQYNPTTTECIEEQTEGIPDLFCDKAVTEVQTWLGMECKE